MNPTDPQFLYMVLILPTLFGLTLIGEGIFKISQRENKGWFSITLGVFFIVVVILAYFYFFQALS